MAAITGVAAAILIVLAATRLVSGSRQPLASLFHYPRESWPRGVQEDDDATWSWSDDGHRAGSAAVADERVEEPAEPSTIAHEIPTDPVRPSGGPRLRD